MAVHDIDVNPVRPGCFNGGDFFAQKRLKSADRMEGAMIFMVHSYMIIVRMSIGSVPLIRHWIR